MGGKEITSMEMMQQPRSGLSSPIEITDAMVTEIVEFGGYPHPLFQTGWKELGMRNRPMPGQGVMALMAGALERSGEWDHAVALIGYENVRFKAPVVVGDAVRLEWKEIEELPWKNPERALIKCEWNLRNQLDEVCVESIALMLVRSIAI